MMERIVGLTIEQETIEIDRKHFVDCLLINCILQYSGEPVEFERTLMRGCSHVFYGRARHTLAYLQGTGLMPYEPSRWGEFSNIVH